MRVSDSLMDTEWDAFVERTPGGHHVQTSLWAQVKTAVGWHATRVIVIDGKHIVGGAQMLIRSIAPFGSIGYITKGPLCISNNPRFLKLIIDGCHQVSKKTHAKCLIVQPPNNGKTIAAQLPGLGFQPSTIRVAPFHTILIDLTEDLNIILGRMRRKTRQHIKRSEREGISVRIGTESDLPIFYNLYVATNRRHNISSFPESYFYKMWHILQPAGFLKLLVTECENEIVSARLIVPFGDTVIDKAAGWSGLHGSHKPNDAILWGCIKWAKAHGYRYFDLEGIDPTVANLILNGDPLPEWVNQTPAFFKLGFGGQITLYPEPYDVVYNPLVRWAYRTVMTRFREQPLLIKIIEYIRKFGRS